MIIRPLRALLAFHKRGTIAAAAEDVHLSPAAVSVQLKQLEEHLGVPLFERTKRSIQMTATGHRVLPLAERLLAAYEELLQNAGGATIRGQISLGVVNGVLAGIFPAVVQRVIDDSPGIEIKISAGTSPELVAKVAAGILDAAVVNNPTKSLGDAFILHRLYTEPIALIHTAGTARSSVFDLLQAQPYIALDRGTWAGQLIQAYLTRNGIDVDPVMELNTQESILAAVRFGLGVSILPIIRGTDTKHDPALRYKRIPGLERVISMVERKNHVRSHVASQVLESFRSVVKEGDKTSATKLLTSASRQHPDRSGSDNHRKRKR